MADELVNAVGRDGLPGRSRRSGLCGALSNSGQSSTRANSIDAPEERAIPVSAMPRVSKVVLDQIFGHAVERDIACLFTFPGNPQMPYSAAFVHKISYLKLAQF